MGTFEKRLESALTELADSEHDHDTERRLVAAHTATTRVSGRSVRRGATYALVGMAAAATALVSLNAAGVLGSQPNQTPTTSAPALGTVPKMGQADGPSGLVEPGEPCPGAVHGLPSEASSKVPVWLPADGTKQVTDSWTCDGTPVIVFGNVQISYETGWDGVDVGTKWAALAADYGGDVTTILGRPALVQSVEQTHGNDNQVLVVIDSTLVRVLARGEVPIPRLTRLLESLQVPQ